MLKKSNLLKEIGWDDKLIQHFMIIDSDENASQEDPLIAEVYDSHSLTLTFDTANSGSSFFVKS